MTDEETPIFERGDVVDFVPITGRGLDLVATTFREERDAHRFVDGALRAGLKFVL